jgi:hypothetical protein
MSLRIRAQNIDLTVSMRIDYEAAVHYSDEDDNGATVTIRLDGRSFFPYNQRNIGMQTLYVINEDIIYLRDALTKIIDILGMEESES